MFPRKGHIYDKGATGASPVQSQQVGRGQFGGNTSQASMINEGNIAEFEVEESCS